MLQSVHNKLDKAVLLCILWQTLNASKNINVLLVDYKQWAALFFVKIMEVIDEHDRKLLRAVQGKYWEVNNF